MASAPFTVQSHLTAISLAYRNASYIADAVLPRVPVLSDSFKYTTYTKADGFNMPDTRVGRKSKPNEIDFSASEATASTVDYALDEVIPHRDIELARAAQATNGVMPVDPMMRSTELLTELVALGREKRVADTVFGTGTYGSSNKATLSGTSQWSHADSDPVSAILAARDGLLMGANTLVLGQSVWTTLRQHPKVVAAVYPLGGNGASGGVASLQALADLLELDRVLVGRAFYNSAKPGQTASFSRLWGKSAALLYLAPVVSATTGTMMTFGFTAQFGDRIAGTVEDDPNIGMRGGTRVRVGESLKETVCAADVGYLFDAAIA